MILKAFKASLVNKGKISCIPNNMERYLSFTIDNLRFIDSFQFMNASLEKLAGNLKRNDFVHSRRHFPEEKVDLLLRKGIFCYDYWDGPDRAEETQLPPISAFYSRLTGDNVSSKDYEHAVTVWREFDIKTLGQYHDLYLKSDVLILSDVFETFRSTCMKHYGVDACHYFSAPGLAWDAMLKMTRVKLQLMTDREMHDIIDKGIRGGICNITTKKARANNKHLGPTEYDSSKPCSSIIYLDMNNLYGTVSEILYITNAECKVYV